MIVIKGVNVFPSAVEEIVQAASGEGLREYQVILCGVPWFAGHWCGNRNTRQLC